MPRLRRGPTPGVWRFETADGLLDVPISGSLRSNSGLALRSAARAGAGIILQPRVILRDDIEAGRLVPLLEAHRPQSRPVQVLTLPGRRPTPKLRVFVDALVRGLGPTAGDDPQAGERRR